MSDMPDRAGGRLPVPVGPHGLDAAVGVLDADWHSKREALAVDVARRSFQARSRGTSRRRASPDDVLALSQVPRHVVGLVLQPMVVARPARGEELVAHALAVHLQLVEAEAGDVDASRIHDTLDRETPAQHRYGLRVSVLVGLGLDPARPPVPRIQQPRLPGGGGAPGRRLPAPSQARTRQTYRARIRARVPRKGRGGSGRDDLARVPDRLPVAGDLYLVGGLYDPRARQTGAARRGVATAR